VHAGVAFYRAYGVGIKPNPVEIGIGFHRGGVRLRDDRRKTRLTSGPETSAGEVEGPGC